MVFLDLEKAFDKIWHDGLLYKLSNMDVLIQLRKVIETFLTGRNFSVRIEDQLSTEKQIVAGVPQGSCLSLTLFSIYIDDVPTIRKMTISLFADDTMFTTKNVNATRAKIQMQKQLDVSME